MLKDLDFLQTKRRAGLSYVDLSQSVPLQPGRISQCANGFTPWALGVREVLVQRMKERIAAQSTTDATKAPQ